MTSSSAFVLAVALALVLPAPLLAQDQAAAPVDKLPLAAAAPVLPPTPEIRVGHWLLRFNSTLNDESLLPPRDGIPRWNLGVRAERPLFSRLNVGAMATVSRGEDGPLSSSAELGSGRSLARNGSLTGPGTYRTVLNTALTFSVPVKTTGQLKIDGIGELWNPFGGKVFGEPANDAALAGRAFKLGVRTKF